MGCSMWGRYVVCGGNRVACDVGSFVIEVWKQKHDFRHVKDFWRPVWVKAKALF